MYQVYSDEIRHGKPGGKPMRSGRFRWGSGKRPYQRLEGTAQYNALMGIRNKRKEAERAIERAKNIETLPGVKAIKDYTPSRNKKEQELKDRAMVDIVRAGNIYLEPGKRFIDTLDPELELQRISQKHGSESSKKEENTKQESTKQESSKKEDNTNQESSKKEENTKQESTKQESSKKEESTKQESSKKEESTKSTTKDNYIDKSKSYANLGKAGKQLTKDMSDLYESLQPKTREVTKPMDLSNMSDEDMRRAVNRSILEKQYMNEFGEKTIVRGERSVTDTLNTIGSAVSVVGGIVSIVAAIKALKN